MKWWKVMKFVNIPFKPDVKAEEAYHILSPESFYDEWADDARKDN